ncbi:MAG: ComF family protein [Salaquimonas sp.]|nr:ComF family protein [Salaquimonas sp.]
MPPACLLCDRLVDTQGGLCATCWKGARFIERPYCEVLGLPFAFDQGKGAVSARALADPPPFDRLRAAMAYDDNARRLVSALKFSDRGDLAPWMAQWMARAGRELIEDCDTVVPVPLHRLRLHERRYNQSAELARAIARLCGLNHAPQVLLRHRRTRQQVGLTSLERARNVQGAFRIEAARRPQIEGRRILLVDDVHTTGATVRACARALKRGGAAAIDVLVFASVVGDDI